jgi:hypothetical protein
VKAAENGQQATTHVDPEARVVKDAPASSVPPPAVVPEIQGNGSVPTSKLAPLFVALSATVPVEGTHTLVTVFVPRVPGATAVPATVSAHHAL